MGSIRIDDGTKEYKIENNSGKEICRIHFRPADLALMDRFENISATLGDVLEPLKEIGLMTDGTPEDQTAQGWETLKKAEAEVIRKFNELFDTDDLGEAFKTRSAFSSIGGKFFCEVLLDAIGGVIAEEFAKEAEATRARIEKYLPTAEEQTDAGAAADNG